MLFWFVLFLIGLALAKFYQGVHEQNNKKLKLKRIQQKIARLETKETKNTKARKQKASVPNEQPSEDTSSYD